MQCAAHGHARGFAVATNRETRSFYFLLLRLCLDTGPVDTFIGGGINRNGFKLCVIFSRQMELLDLWGQERSNSMERKAIGLVGHAHQRLVNVTLPSAASTSVAAATTEQDITPWSSKSPVTCQLPDRLGLSCRLYSRRVA